MAQMQIDTLTIQQNEWLTVLREMVREVVREELQRFAVQMVDEDWEIEENSVLWEDLMALQADKRAGTLKLLTHAEVFGK